MKRGIRPEHPSSAEARSAGARSLARAELACSSKALCPWPFGALDGSAHSAGGVLVAGVCGGLHVGVGDGLGDAVGFGRRQVVGRSRARRRERAGESAAMP